MVKSGESDAGSRPRVSLPTRAKKAGRQKLSVGRPARVGRPVRTTQDDPAQVDLRGLGDPTSTRGIFSLGRILVFLKGFLDFLIETIRFSRDCINTIVIPKL